jgi:hypothetical protein
MNRWVSVAFFLTFASGLTCGVHYYFWARLVRDAALPQPYFRIGTVVFVLLAVLVPATLISARLFPKAVPWLMYAAFSWLGCILLLFFALLTSDVVGALFGLWERFGGGAPLDPEKRLFLARALAGTAGAVAATGAVAGLIGARQKVEVKQVPLTLKKWPRGLDGYAIVQVSDIHLGPTIGRAFMEDLVARINALEPDLVAITGDLVDGSVEALREAAAPLAQLKSRHGTFFVTGNHEYYAGADEWIAHLRSLGIRVLRNERVRVGDAAGAFELAGTDDRMAHLEGHGEDLPRALGNRDASTPVVLMAHQPRSFPDAAKLGVDLQLSGHTHGGQIFPWGMLVQLQQGFLAGLFQRGDSTLYVSRGTGYWGPPMRLGAPAEITRLVFKAA